MKPKSIHIHNKTKQQQNPCNCLYYERYYDIFMSEIDYQYNHITVKIIFILDIKLLCMHWATRAPYSDHDPETLKGSVRIYEIEVLIYM